MNPESRIQESGVRSGTGVPPVSIHDQTGGTPVLLHILIPVFCLLTADYFPQ